LAVVTFRGATDQSFGRAVAFVGDTVNDAMSKQAGRPRTGLQLGEASATAAPATLACRRGWDFYGGLNLA